MEHVFNMKEVLADEVKEGITSMEMSHSDQVLEKGLRRRSVCKCKVINVESETTQNSRNGIREEFPMVVISNPPEASCKVLDKEPLAKIEFPEISIEMNRMSSEEGDLQGFERFYEEACEAFDWDDLLYSFLFGLLPSTIDILTDFRFAFLLDTSEQSLIAAGLAYAIIILPGIDFSFYFVFQTIWDNLGDSLKVKIPVLFLYIVIIGLLLLVLFLSIIHHPTILFYPAVLIAVCLLSMKVAAVVIHTPQVKRLSTMASGSEANFEASYQLLLVAFTWLAGGGRHLLPMTTSLLVIGKTRAERHLNSQPNYQMHEKTFEEKVVLVSAHIPIFSLAAVFRLGSLALIFSCLTSIPDSATSLFLFHVSFFCYGSLMPLLLLIISRWHQPLAQLTALHACQGVIGSPTHSAPLRFYFVVVSFCLSRFFVQAQFHLCLSGQV